MTDHCRRRCRASFLLLALAAAACEKAPPPPLLVIDGIRIEIAEVDPFVAFLDSYIPEGGRKSKVARVLEEHVIPLRLAQRTFVEQRHAQLQRAQDLSSVATNVEELERRVAALDKIRAEVGRMQPKIPIAMFLFDPLKTGAVSPPIELPYGYVVAACYGITESAMAMDDRADTLQVTFATHDNHAWRAWLDAEEKRIRDKVTFVHPDYREAVPTWLVLPKLP